MPRRQTKKSHSGKPAPAQESGGMERLQKVLAAAGIGSRRECEEVITGGRVEVDGEFVTEFGLKVDPTKHRIQVDGVALPKPKRVYFALNKPVGVVSTNSDPDGRPRVIDLIKSNERLYPVGRLDRTSEGLILVTNDGELANRLTHPRYGVEKVYRVRVVGKPTPEELAQVRKGVYLSDGLARVSSIQMKRSFKQSTELEIVLQEGLNREIRRILARVGHKVVQLKRVAIGPIRLGTMPVGAHRMLSREEVQALRKATKRSRKSDGSAKPAGEARPVRSTSKSTTVVLPETATATDATATSKPRRRKSGSSAMSGYSRPTKKGVKRKKSAASFHGGQQTGGAASTRGTKPAARPKKKTAKTSTRPSKPISTKKKSSRSGKASGKPPAAGKKKTARKRRR